MAVVNAALDVLLQLLAVDSVKLLAECPRLFELFTLRQSDFVRPYMDQYEASSGFPQAVPALRTLSP